jgi:hypothetical protein
VAAVVEAVGMAVVGGYMAVEVVAVVGVEEEEGGGCPSPVLRLTATVMCRVLTPLIAMGRYLTPVLTPLIAMGSSLAPVQTRTAKGSTRVVCIPDTLYAARGVELEDAIRIPAFCLVVDIAGS